MMIDGIKAQARRVSKRTTVDADELERALRAESYADRNFADSVIERVIADATRKCLNWRDLLEWTRSVRELGGTEPTVGDRVSFPNSVLESVPFDSVSEWGLAITSGDSTGDSTG